jgi:poly(hydroxyalkanoate) depolymerase family esterase
MTRYQNQVAALLTIGSGLLAATPALAGSWQSNAPFGATLQGDLYTPTTPGSSPAILVAIHYCSGNSSNAHSWFQSYADQYGFYIIAPNAGKNCFDSSASRSGDRAAIVTMVNYVLAHTSANKARVFSAGLSSGGCMTNTLLAIYPDVFAGGAAMPGFPAGLWPAGDTSCTKCGSSPGGSDTGQYYANLVRNAFSWSGQYPCSEQWVGGGDQYNFNGWLPVVASEFQILGNLGSGSPGTGAPSGWTRTVYKDGSGNVRLETNLGPSSQAHDLSNVAGMFGQVVTFLGLDKPTGACGLTGSGTGGAPGTGGTSSTGGTSTGGRATGGTSTGGASTGGTSTGGKATGGLGVGGQASGGRATGGTSTVTGGSSTGGTSLATGGTSLATGGTSLATGGTPAGGTGTFGGTSGTTSIGGTGGSGGSPEGQGCSCRTAPSQDGHGKLFGLVALSVLALRRRRTRR